MSTFITRDNVEIYYRDQGSGDPVVLIHGWPLSSDMWEYQELSLLEGGYRVICYDRRGFGHSGPSAGSYDYDTLADDLSALISHLGLERVALAGFSMGGGEVARYLARHGARRVSRALLISSVVPCLLRSDENPNGVTELQLEEMKEGLREDRHYFLSGFARDFYGVGILSSAVSQQVLDWTLQIANRASLKATIDCVDSFGRTDFRGDLSSFTVPTLVIHGGSDKTVPYKATAAAAAGAIRGATLKIYDGAPHGLFFTHKERLNEDLLLFLSGGKAKGISAA